MVKERNIALCVIFSLLTCGIYGLYWLVNITDDVTFLSGEEGPSGVLTLILIWITCGLYGFYWAYKLGDRLDIAKQKRGIPSSNGGVLYLILYLLGGILTYILVQNEINKLSRG